MFGEGFFQTTEPGSAWRTQKKGFDIESLDVKLDHVIKSNRTRHSNLGKQNTPHN
jgi:hypothetical protein